MSFKPKGEKKRELTVTSTGITEEDHPSPTHLNVASILWLARTDAQRE